MNTKFKSGVWHISLAQYERERLINAYETLQPLCQVTNPVQDAAKVACDALKEISQHFAPEEGDAA